MVSCDQVNGNPDTTFHHHLLFLQLLPWYVPQKYLDTYPLDSIVEGKVHKEVLA